MHQDETNNALRGIFATTHWSVILAAGPNDTTAASAAWEKLASLYWYPVYSHVRRRVSSPEEAQDLVQEFFITLLRRESLATVAPEKGRFRTFLLTSLKYFLSDQFHRTTAEKRGGRVTVVSFDALEAEERHRLEPTSNDSPDKEFDRRWAAVLIERALQRLEEHQKATGKFAQFQRLKEFLGREVEPGEYDPIAEEFKQSTNTVAASVRRLRLQLRELVLEEVLHTASTPTDAEAELRGLFGR